MMRKSHRKPEKQINKLFTLKSYNCNIVICPIHKVPMFSLVNAFRDDLQANTLNVETFACVKDACTKQAVIYSGDTELYLRVKEHYGIKHNIEVSP